MVNYPRFPYLSLNNPNSQKLVNPPHKRSEIRSLKSSMQSDSTSFEKIQARKLVIYAIFAFIATFFSLAILSYFLPTWFKDRSSPLSTVLSGLLLYVFFFLFILRMLSRAGLSYNRLFGTFPAWHTIGRYSLWAIPLVIFSIASAYLLFFPLSFLSPGLVKSWLIDLSPTLIWRSGDGYVLANLLNFLMVVMVAPVLEEFFFRGILLTRWTVKWGVIPAIIVSSVVFSVPHVINLIGLFCFGCVMAIFYIRTKSLFIPICIHVMNNLIAWFIEFRRIYFDDPISHKSVTEFQESWWVGLVTLVISIPFLFLFWRRYISNIDWQMPYLTKSTHSDDTTNSDT